MGCSSGTTAPTCRISALQTADGAAEVPTAESASLADKVPRVCEALQAAMAAADPRRYFKAILTALSKVRPSKSLLCSSCSVGGQHQVLRLQICLTPSAAPGRSVMMYVGILSP